MKEKINLFIITLILILPITLYALFKAPSSSTTALASEKSRPTVTIFSSAMCMECKKLKKVIKIIEPKYEKQIIFKKIDANIMSDEISDKIKKYKVTLVPTTIFENQEKNILIKKEGAISKGEFERNLNELLK